MAITTNVPPQAYTRDTLVKAIEWLSGQPAAVREKAVSADLVVSFFLQACRNHAARNEAPVSGEHFKNDLKHLAEDLKQFDEVAPPQGNHFFSHGPAERAMEVLPPPAPIFKPEPLARTEPAVKAVPWPVDARSLAAARDVQQRLNLGSEVEALRMLITLGAERAKALFS